MAGGTLLAVEKINCTVICLGYICLLHVNILIQIGERDMPSRKKAPKLGPHKVWVL